MPKRSLTIWIILTVIVTAGLSYALPGSSGMNEYSTFFLPGKTTHGHYQIELACSACHTPFGGVKEQSCIDCHGADLKAGKDTHPASKFDDPSNLKRLEIIDAQKCITCHAEHVDKQTHPMGVTLPLDYCIRCHEDVADDRPSHKGMTFQSCSTAGCHNYHDNLALYEKFLDDHYGEADFLEEQTVAVPVSLKNSEKQLTAEDHDCRIGQWAWQSAITDWSQSVHAQAGVNCSGCHNGLVKDKNGKSADAGAESSEWVVKPNQQQCAKCHQQELDGWQAGKHGMRTLSGLSPMQPQLARLPMHPEVGHHNLDCHSCHKPHQYDREYASMEACLKCHADDHSQNYASSGHYQLWKQELSGKLPAGSGVSCATCHMPRSEDSSLNGVAVEHNQNLNLQPNEKMIRTVCMNCHGLQFSLDALADPQQKIDCYSQPTSVEVESVQMARDWFEAKRLARERRKKSK